MITKLILVLSSILVLYLGYKIKFQKRVDLINLYNKKNKIKDVNLLCEFIGNRLISLSILVLAMAFFINSNIIVNTISLFIFIITIATAYTLYFSGKYLH